MKIYQNENKLMNAYGFYDTLREISLLMDLAIHRTLDQLGLTLEQYDTLRQLDEQTGRRVGELRRRIFVENSKMTRLMDQMEELGWAERRPDPTDRRAWQVYLTKAGAEARQQATDLHTTYLEQMLQPVADGREETLKHALQELLDLLREEEARQRPE